MTELPSEQLPKTELWLTNEIIRVLHVDDDEDFLISSKRYLEKQGLFQIETALSVREAQQKIAQHQYDVIVSDYQLPEKTGLDLLEELRANGNDVPFVLFTGESREEVAIEAITRDVERYFNKNGNKNTLYVELAHSIKKAVKAKKAEKQLRNIAKFPSENPNPVLRVTTDGLICYANKSAQQHNCELNKENKQFVPEGLRQSVASALRSGLTEEVEIECNNQLFSFVIAPIPKEGYANVYGRNISENVTAWNSLEVTINELVMINEKLGVVGRLTRHDARNKLSVILNNIYLAKRVLPEDNNALEYLQSVESAVDQMEQIFEFARSYEMLGIEELAYSNVEKVFNEASMLFSGVENIRFVNKCSRLTVLADSLLRQLFYNLIHNSLEHGETVSQIKVEYRDEKKQLRLIYEDNGIGIPDDEKERIFGEGYGKGTGYGLYLIRKICDAYGWEIQETGNHGKGAQFTMTIQKTSKKGKLSYRFEKE
ncbi:MAG: response regulator [Candidatus Bathyarchaeota archaeon]|nr:response regulator [Candidatus Bathyarchaeum sp.]